MLRGDVGDPAYDGLHLVDRGAARLPLLRDPDVSYYMRQERQGLILGPYEWQATAHWLDRIPDEFANQLFDDDLGRLEKYIEAACERAQAARHACGELADRGVDERVSLRAGRLDHRMRHAAGVLLRTEVEQHVRAEVALQLQA